MSKKKNLDKTRNLLSLGIVIGTVAGAAGAFFMAPQKGKETQKTLARSFNHITQKTILEIQNALIKFEMALDKEME